MEIVVVEEEREEGSALVARLIRTSISLFASDGLDEAFGFAIGLGAVGFSEEMFEAELLAGGGEEVGAVSRAAKSTGTRISCMRTSGVPPPSVSGVAIAWGYLRSFSEPLRQVFRAPPCGNRRSSWSCERKPAWQRPGFCPLQR